MASRLPRWVNSDHLTGLGAAAMLGAGVSYALAPHWPPALLLVVFFLVLNWFGDSLDGTLARVRRIERPRYGYYLDHVVDAYSTAVIGIGLGVSPYVSFGIALGLVVVYLVLSINVYLESTVFGAFRLAYGRLGPTELRLILITINGALALHHDFFGQGVVPVRIVADAVCTAAGLGMLVMLVIRFARNLRALAQLEPPKQATPYSSV